MRTREGAALHIRDLRHGYADHTALKLDALDLQAGEQLVVLGPSGCGKTTLLHAIAGLLQPTQGHIQVGCQTLSALKPAALDRFRGRHFGIVFQRLHLLPALNIRQNLLLAQRLARMPQDPMAVLEMLASLGIAELAHARPASLSQGQRQRVAIARALIHQPSIVLADEPTSSLDDDNADRAMTLLREHARSCAASLLVVTHDQRMRGAFERELLLEAPA